jgi:hypothetical protein
VNGHRAFHRATPADAVSAVLKEDPPDLTTSATAHVPAARDRIVRRCLEKDPDDPTVVCSASRYLTDLSLVEGLKEPAAQVCACGRPRDRLKRQEFRASVPSQTFGDHHGGKFRIWFTINGPLIVLKT